MKLLKNTLSMFKRKSGKSNEKGFTLIELIIALAIIGGAIAAMLFYQSRAEANQKVNATVLAMTKTASDVKVAFGAANTYEGVDDAAMIAAGFTSDPFVVNGAVINDPWGGQSHTGGSPLFFGLSTTAPNKDVCMKLAAALAENGTRVVISAGAPAYDDTGVTAATFLPGTAVKADLNETFDPVVAGTACDADVNISVVYR